MFNKVLKPHFAIVLLFLLVGWFLYTFRILEVPPGINGDEAVIGYNAALVAKNGFDSNGKFLPLFTGIAVSKDWKQPVTVYATALAFRIFGPSYFILRSVSVFFVLLSGILIFLLVYELLDLKVALWSLLIFATTPIVMIQSHLALENIAPVPFITFFLWMMVRYNKEKRVRFLVLAAATLALSVFSYLGLRIILPSLITITVLFIYYLNKEKPKVAVKLVLIFLAVLIPFLLILIVAKGNYPGSLLGLYRSFEISSYQRFILTYISSFDWSFLFINGDVTPYHSTGKHGVFLLASLPLFLLGIVRIIQKKQPVLIFIMSAFFLMPIFFGLASDIYRGSRLLSLIPPYIVISSLGILVLTGIRNKLRRVVLISIVTTLIIFNFADFTRDYWHEYPQRVKSEFSKPYHLAYERAAFLSRQSNLTPFIQDDFRMQNKVAQNFFEQVYFPNGLRTWSGGQVLPDKSIIIVSDYFLSKKKDILQEKIGDGEFGILINNENR